MYIYLEIKRKSRISIGCLFYPFRETLAIKLYQIDDVKTNHILYIYKLIQIC